MVVHLTPILILLLSSPRSIKELSFLDGSSFHSLVEHSETIPLGEIGEL